MKLHRSRAHKPRRFSKILQALREQVGGESVEKVKGLSLKLAAIIVKHAPKAQVRAWRRIFYTVKADQVYSNSTRGQRSMPVRRAMIQLEK